MIDIPDDERDHPVAGCLGAVFGLLFGLFCTVALIYYVFIYPYD